MGQSKSRHSTQGQGLTWSDPGHDNAGFICLAAFETERGADFPHFFKIDLARPIWRFLRRGEGWCAGEKMNAAGCIYALPSASLVCVTSNFVTGCEKHVILAAYDTAVR